MKPSESSLSAAVAPERELVAAKVERARVEQPHVGSLDGLRFFAFFGVFAFHALQNNKSEQVRALAHYGALGVQVFFVLSGFLIGRILLEAKAQQSVSIGQRLRTFYARRALRIFPLYYMVLLVLLVLPSLGLTVLGGREVFFWNATYLTNIYWYVTGAGPGGLSHFWTLAVEEHFYMIAPLVLLNAPIAGLSRGLVGLWLACSVIRAWLTARGDNLAFLLSPLQFDCMTVGIAAALLQTHGKFLSFDRAKANKLALVCAVLSPLLLGLRLVPHTSTRLVGAAFEQWVFAVAVAGLVLMLWNGKWPVLTRLLALKPLSYLGKISYGLYVFHLPCLVLAAFWFGPYMQHGTAVPALLLTIGLSMLSWHLFESPINDLKRYFPYAKR